MVNPYSGIFTAQQQPQGPQMPMQWQQMGDPNQQNQDLATGGAGLGALLKRFKKPSLGNSGAVDAPMLGGGIPGNVA